jgi:antitoxin component of RelBE/YafQ-DinJ toxin-antitoxin module
MSKTITMNIRVDEATRQGLKDFAARLGIPASSLVNASIRQMLRAQAVTFTTALEPTPYLQKIIKEAEADYKAGKNITRVTNRAELEAYLDTL